MPVIQNQVVDGAGWMTDIQFADIVTISEMTPGPIILNAATFTGQQMAGFPGALAATAGSIFPSLIIVSVIAYFYFSKNNTTGLKSVMRAMRPAVAALVFYAGVLLFITALTAEPFMGLPIDPIACIMLVVYYVLLKKFHKSPIFVICISAAAGVIIYLAIPQLAGV